MKYYLNQLQQVNQQYLNQQYLQASLKGKEKMSIDEKIEKLIADQKAEHEDNTTRHKQLTRLQVQFDLYKYNMPFYEWVEIIFKGEDRITVDKWLDQKEAEQKALK